MYSPIGTVVFEILLLLENPHDVLLVLLDFQGTVGGFRPYSINEMGLSGYFHNNFTDNILTNVSLNQELDPINGNDIYQFEISLLAFGNDYDFYSLPLANFILYRKGKLIC